LVVHLRTDEVVPRIWIASFVDADGGYREDAHVRVLLEPAGWRVARRKSPISALPRQPNQTAGTPYPPAKARQKYC